MSTATMTTKGQITIPAAVRAALGIEEAGDRVEFVQVEPGRFELVPATNPVTALKGLVRKPASLVTVEDMNKAIAAQGAKARWLAGHQRPRPLHRAGRPEAVGEGDEAHRVLDEGRARLCRCRIRC